MAELSADSAMAREIAEIPATSERLLTRTGLFAAIAKRIEQARPRIVVLCGRGSSGHVGVYLRYLFETRLGWLTSAAAPSVMTAYQRRPDFREALFIVISQSGRSPDLVASTQIARGAGALTLSIVNDQDSPAAAAAELVLPIAAGPERAVAATKTVVLSMLAGATLVATLAGDDLLQGGLDELPMRFFDALSCDWSAWADKAASAPAAFIVGRGYSLGCAREIALKTTEVLRVPALGYSAAELRHGPRAAITSSTPLLVLRQNDEVSGSVDDLISNLRDDGEEVFSAGGMHGALPWIGDRHPACDPIVMLVPTYRAIEQAARRRGLDPDNPPYLRKVTRTL
jgi:glucosamine--fructose-6-phosphate aminotransferase (isomerizing)